MEHIHACIHREIEFMFLARTKIINQETYYITATLDDSTLNSMEELLNCNTSFVIEISQFELVSLHITS